MPTKTTIYSAIDRGLIPNVTRESLYTRNATVFSDGMIHLPKWVREKLSINDGDNLLVEVDDDRKWSKYVLKKRFIHSLLYIFVLLFLVRIDGFFYFKYDVI